MAVTKHSDAVAPLRSAGPVTIWLGRHGSTARASFGRLLQQPFASLMIILVIAVTLAIPAALNLVIKNFTAISAGWDNALDFSVFLDTGVSLSEAEALARLIAQRADVDDVRLITAERGARGIQGTVRLRQRARSPSRQPAAAYARGAAQPRQHAAVDDAVAGRARQPARDRARAGRHGMGAAIPRHTRNRAAGDRDRRRPARRRDRRDHRQHDPARHPESPRRDRGHQADRREQRLRAPAVSVERLLVRAVRRRCSPWASCSTACTCCSRRSPGSPASTRAA